MINIIGFVKQLKSKIFVLDSQGTIKEIKEGDELGEGDIFVNHLGEIPSDNLISLKSNETLNMKVEENNSDSSLLLSKKERVGKTNLDEEIKNPIIKDIFDHSQAETNVEATLRDDDFLYKKNDILINSSEEVLSSTKTSIIGDITHKNIKEVIDTFEIDSPVNLISTVIETPNNPSIPTPIIEVNIPNEPHNRNIPPVDSTPPVMETPNNPSITTPIIEVNIPSEPHNRNIPTVDSTPEVTEVSDEEIEDISSIKEIETPETNSIDKEIPTVDLTPEVIEVSDKEIEDISSIKEIETPETNSIDKEIPIVDLTPEVTEVSDEEIEDISSIKENPEVLIGNNILTFYSEPSITNLSFIVDISSSMNDFDILTTENAIKDTINLYEDVNINLIQFYGSGKHESGWIKSLDDVDSYTWSEDDNESTQHFLDNSKSGTDIEQGLRALVENSYGENNEPIADNDIVYFFGDGNTYGSYQRDFDDFTGVTRDNNGDIIEINNDNEWSNFITNGNIDKLYTYSVNTDNVLSDIAHIADNNENNISVDAKAVSIEGLNNDIDNSHYENSKDGDFSKNSDGSMIVEFGEDKKYFDSITINNNTVTYDEENPIQTIEGEYGNFIVDLNDGTYKYEVKDSNNPINHVEKIDAIIVNDNGEAVNTLLLDVNIEYADISITENEDNSSEAIDLPEADNEEDDIETLVTEEEDNSSEVIDLSEVDNAEDDIETLFTKEEEDNSSEATDLPEADNAEDDIETLVTEEEDNSSEVDVLEMEEINFDNLDDDHQFESNDNEDLYIEDIIETEDENINIEDVGKVDAGKKEQQSTTIYNDYNTSLHSHNNIKVNVYDESYMNAM
ncbi:DNA topoisomerase IV subunit A [hydrothermal vent metagenome]|uniref:DNA topoisomerase IV subunit A n=1 Tax=hydrothermal vent metagenome TaxID=652676 RepID=A0A1W1CGP4_9ZZZZ